SPLRIIAQNRGFTTKAANNLFVGASDDILSDELFGDNKNYVCAADDINALEMRPKEIFFEPIEMKFGRTDKPKPETAVKTGAETVCTEAEGMVLIQPDESVRSMAGLSGFEGAFVKAIAQNSPFYLLGVRENDVIVEINGKKTVSPKDVDGKNEINSVAVSRAQKRLEFKKAKQ
ncbi:MAG: hypothetical protein IKX78_05205, partial [Clostridia bacterium]|nr:hypothetical protein [Clostridia bacterium]